jgi:hypothetical protein
MTHRSEDEREGRAAEDGGASGAREAREASGMSRRTLLKAGSAATLAGTIIGGGIAAADGGSQEAEEWSILRGLGAERDTYWDKTGTYFSQKNVDLKQLSSGGFVRAKIDGKWQDFTVREIDDAFFDFNMKMRIRMFEVMAGSKSYDIYNDAHNAAVGTYGSNRGDSRFLVNVAFKGMGWVPKPDYLDDRIQELQDNYTASMMTKVQLLYEGYQNTSMWDRRFFGSLELYTTVDNETHSFLNQMVNPVSTICTLADESYEFRTVARLMHVSDPGLTSWEKKVMTYINYAHDFFHGGPDPDKLTVHNNAVMYFIIEEFDNSPFGATDTAGGQRRVPVG